ncbi:sialate O-acetylesterase [Haloferula sargassicola]|uniref:Sialate O-acetylesterase domain-containing protein n=1 Tax=Haloferula sargassicola TaxID=490096 RepID=A0ABP9UIW1_9BACT
MKTMGLLAAWMVAGTALAEVTIDPPFASHMVLQRGVPIELSGTAAAGAGVKVTMGATTAQATADEHGAWRVKLGPQPAGGPMEIVARDGGGEALLEDVLLGDVWLFSGQSNMQMGLDEVIGGPEAITAAGSNPQVRVLSMPKAGSPEPVSDIGAEWRSCTPESLTKFSAVAWFFGKHLRDDPKLDGVPLGLIDSSFGGTAIEAWTPPGTLPEIPADQVSGSMFGIPASELFNRMIHPLTALPVKGAAWYQGEANAGHPGVYDELLENLISRWREAWRQPDLPFFVVQLPAFEGTMGGLDFGWLREAETRACEATERAWQAVSYDTTDGSDLHPWEKEEIGRRIALIARREVYGSEVVAHGPRFEGVRVEGKSLVLSFDQALKTTDGEPVRGLAVAGKDGDFRFVEGRVEKETVVLTPDSMSTPPQVRFAWGGLPDANLVNEAGLPAVPFRTDDLPPASLAFQPEPTVYRIETPGYSLETGRGGSVTSLVTGGKQFMSHEPGGGTKIPGGWGPRNLGKLTLTGPNRMTLSDGRAVLELACAENAMTWTLTNPDKDAFEFRIAIASEVQVQAGETLRLSRDGAGFELRGVTRTDGHTLVVEVPGGGTRELSWTVRPGR